MGYCTLIPNVNIISVYEKHLQGWEGELCANSVLPHRRTWEHLPEFKQNMGRLIYLCSGKSTNLLLYHSNHVNISHNFISKLNSSHTRNPIETHKILVKKNVNLWTIYSSFSSCRWIAENLCKFLCKHNYIFEISHYWFLWIVTSIIMKIHHLILYI